MQKITQTINFFSLRKLTLKTIFPRRNNINNKNLLKVYQNKITKIVKEKKNKVNFDIDNKKLKNPLKKIKEINSSFKKLIKCYFFYGESQPFYNILFKF
ncbi:hypothetical protein RFI_06478 [Reticulomyxa filosa]|uniref:Uncharacterized protein n=1 Tax=Reticulomyxa filosa TaxID=46433 RepID=X6NXN4_RETFI|nr:hypothetical protein RFI_06478 [Reticulomyxa filosa]|eukprot:ETO30643.1 hypothetical protein RFI_06478 [Reticulomyxa filosa]